MSAPDDPVHEPPEPTAPGAATMLPATVPARTGRSPRLVVTVVVAVVVLAVVVVVLALLASGGSGTASKPVAARVAGKVPKTAILAASNASLPDQTAVLTDARSLLAGKLPAATVSASVRDALIHLPAVGSATPVLTASLPLDDPQLPACIASVTGGGTLFGIDTITYAGQRSLLIVAADSDSVADAYAYVIGAGCAAPGTGIRTVVTIPL